ncbi:MAG: metallophosphoesterase family protein, partial [Thermofilaceae archaeon]
MPKIGIISDTHDNLQALDNLLNKFEERGVKSLIHAGDIIAPFTLKRILERNFEFNGVFGNNDGELLTLSKIAEKNGVFISQQPL